MRSLTLALTRLAMAWLLSASVYATNASTLMEIARETSDPTAELWYFSTEFALAFDSRASFRQSNQLTWELQPSLPIPLTKNWRLLNFPDLVLASQGTSEGLQLTGIETFDWLAAFSPTPSRSGLAWGLGPYVSLPASTSAQFGPSQWQTGLGGVIAWRTPQTVASVQIHSGWTTDRSSPIAQSVQIETNAQYIFNNGMQVGLGHPRIEYTRNRDGSGQWDVPVGANIARTFHVGKMPIKIMIEFDFYVMNDSHWQPEHLFRLTILPVLPSPFKGPIFE